MKWQMRKKPEERWSERQIQGVIPTVQGNHVFPCWRERVTERERGGDIADFKRTVCPP